MIGADGQQYGPVSLDQIKGWIREGRVTAVTQILRSDVNSWLAASQYTELGLAQAPSAPVPLNAPGNAPAMFASADTASVMARANLERRIRSGAGWFFFIGAFSLVNAIVIMSGQTWRFVIGLGITDIIAAFSSGLQSGGMAVGLTLDVLVLGVFVVFGVFARKKHSWSFIAGMLCYAADGLLLLAVGAQTMSLVFHGIGLFFMFTGLQANLKWKAMQRGAGV
jgi:hypothetical protein